MSLSGLFSAKKRIETSIKKYEIPVEEKPEQVDSCKNGVLLLSLLQSRLNWTNYIFPKYKSDPIQQPKRTNTTRKKWPNMTYLGTCTLELGAHVFEHTNFYQAVRAESWNAIASSEGLIVEPLSETDQTMTENLTFNDIVFELNEVSNERFIFPKEAIIEIIKTNEETSTIHVSFVLPVDQTLAEAFFDTPKNKILKHGKTCQLEIIRNFVDSNKADESDASPFSRDCEPTNIRISKANEALVDALKNSVDDPTDVAKAMERKMKHFSGKKYIKFDLTEDATHKTEIEDLVQKASTIPDITTGPIQAEKKRNEILNAIKLGKRSRDEKFEAELPKNKYLNVKEDGLLKCAYCSTKHTYMWRPGPAGQGTLCNSCGIQWKRGEILVDAPVISKEEEAKLLQERKEREKAAEVIEAEKTDRETKKQQKKLERQNTASLGGNPFAAQLLKRKSHSAQSSSGHLPSQQHIPSNNNISTSSSQVINSSDSTLKKPQTVKPKKSKPRQQAETSNTQPPIQKAQEQTKSVPLSLYSTAGIPLPTLSIDFAGSMQFCHPNCGITLLDRYFSVRLCKDGCDQTTINFDKDDLMSAEFEVASEGDSPLQRDILRMKIKPEPKSIVAFNQTLTIDQTHNMHVRFLEKLDPSGGAVVQRILQRWLVTVPQ